MDITLPGRFKPGDTVTIIGQPFIWIVEGMRMRISVGTRRSRTRPPRSGRVVTLVRNAGWATIRTEVLESQVREYTIA
ncbi:hypothetical protein HOT75_gp086 [Gordonia phage Daredevil]|uniref:Uncharacterized protein n=1 Tax=Gordonia phage Daredevil TaxID=2283286 RepID=A0A345MIU2_9CAUD|nr:hypothetical protein HOT75_gp086 [Gordonia phage Daredevil]AXH70473.1 hypothetical protein SEA_DAREDEVIL_86 [Gordonia phage Daredevil]